VDVGTTTVVAQLVHLKSGNVVGVAGSHNPQAHYGEDVISRMIFACGRDNGVNPLHDAEDALRFIREVIRPKLRARGSVELDPHKSTGVMT